MKYLGRVLCACWLIAVAMPSWSLSEGFYTGLELGYSSSSYNGNNVKVSIPALGLSSVPLDTAASNLDPTFAAIPSSGALETDNDGVGGRLYLGYKFYKILSIEGGYTRYADSVIKNTFQISSSDFTIFGADKIVGTNTRVEQQSLDLSAKVFVPILDLFELYGMLGMAYLDTFLPTKATVTTIPNTTGGGATNQIKISRTHSSNYEMMYGFGGGYSFNDSFIFGLTYQQVQPSSKKIEKSSLVALDFIFSFG